MKYSGSRARATGSQDGFFNFAPATNYSHTGGMDLLTDYIQPLIAWLHVNPEWSLFFTFLISLSESFAIIGVIVPGSVTMTAIGILAGSGVIRVDLTLIAAILGAIAGDSLSYAVGYHYRDRLLDIWPFKKYPIALAYGKEFFKRHGGKSVLLGRFIGPLRALIPIIAGMMHMKQGRFLMANVISAIGWSLLYVLPGVLIGTASAELSPESAARLFFIVIILLAAIWFFSIFLKFLFNKISTYLKKNLHYYWLSIKKHPSLYQFFELFTPAHEENHYPTVMILILTLCSLVAFLLLLMLQIQATWINDLNLPIYWLLKSFPSSSLQGFFIFCTQLTSQFTLACQLLICLFYLLLRKEYKLLNYIFSTLFFSFLFAFWFTKIIHSPAPHPSQYGFSFPSIIMSMATAFYSFIYFYFSFHYNFLTYVLRTVLFTVLGLSGLGTLYLGDYWLSDVIAAYALGLFISLNHYLIYRKLNTPPRQKKSSSLIFFTIVTTILLISGLSTAIYFKKIKENHTVIPQEYYIFEEIWWNQEKTILPLYLLNRLGKPISTLNIQFVGDLDHLKRSLQENNWKTHTESFFTKLMQRLNQKSHTVKLPLLEILFENKRPDLMMTLKDAQSKLILELRLWHSAYYLKESDQAIWIGNIRINQQKETLSCLKSKNPLEFLYPSLKEFDTKTIKLKGGRILSKTFYLSPILLLIKNKESIEPASIVVKE